MENKYQKWKFLSPAEELEIFKLYNEGVVRRRILTKYRITANQFVYLVRLYTEKDNEKKQLKKKEEMQKTIALKRYMRS